MVVNPPYGEMRNLIPQAGGRFINPVDERLKRRVAFVGNELAETLFGAGDPRLMAGGISQALITTVLGLTVAIPTLLLHNVVQTRAQALTDILQDLTLQISSMNLEGTALATLLDGMSNVEHRLAFGTDEKLQTASLVGVFVKTRQSLEIAPLS